MLTIGIDIGTTNIKGILLHPEGKKITSVSLPTRIHYQGTEIADFHPQEIWEDVQTIITELSTLCSTPERIKAISFASFGESGLLVNENGDPLAPSIAWFDHRSNAIMEAWRKNVDDYEFYQTTGMRVSGISSLAKILWEKENRYPAYRKAKKWLFVPSYIIFKLTGEYVTEYSIASRSALFDIRQRRWSENVAGMADIPIDLLPSVMPSGTPVGEISNKVAAALGLRRNTLIVLGGHDHPCGAFSAGLRREGEIVNSSGTVDAVYALIDPARIDRSFLEAGVNFGCHVSEGKTYLMGGILTAGILVDWFIDNFYIKKDETKEKVYEFLVRDAGDSPVGSNGVVILPHLRGACTSHDDPESKGTILGLRTTHNYRDIARAVFEGLSFELRQVLDKYSDLTGDPYPEVKCIGGGSKNRFWVQLKADVTGRKMIVDNIQENASFGAAILAGIGAGIYPNADRAFETIKRIEAVYRPNSEHSTIYNQLYDKVYRNLYDHLRGVNHDIEEVLKIR